MQKTAYEMRISDWSSDVCSSDLRHSYVDDFGFGRVDAGRDIYVGSRAGILATPSMLVYVKGGYTNEKLNVLAGDTDEETDTNFKLDGWRVGAGVEHAIGSNSFAKVEYRSSNYNRAHLPFLDCATKIERATDRERGCPYV